MAAATAEQLGVEPPNLDCLSIDPDDYVALAQVLHIWGDYCAIKARAMRARAAGRIGRATLLERSADRLYSSLPRGARW